LLYYNLKRDESERRNKVRTYGPLGNTRTFSLNGGNTGGKGTEREKGRRFNYQVIIGNREEQRRLEQTMGKLRLERRDGRYKCIPGRGGRKRVLQGSLNEKRCYVEKGRSAWVKEPYATVGESLIRQTTPHTRGWVGDI